MRFKFRREKGQARDTKENGETGTHPGAKSALSSPEVDLTVIEIGVEEPIAEEFNDSAIVHVTINTDDGLIFSASHPRSAFEGKIDELFCWIHNLQLSGSILIVGEKAGASMALLLGALIPAASVFAINPAPRAGHSSSLNHPYWSDVANITSSLPTKQNAVSVFSSWDPKYSLFLAETDALFPALGKVVTLPTAEDGSAFLVKNGILGSMLRGNVDVVSSLRSVEVIDIDASRGHPAQFLAMARVSELLAKGADHLAETLPLIRSFSDWRNAGWQTLRSEAFYKLGMTSDALSAARNAAQSGPEAASFCLNFARLVIEGSVIDQRELAISLLSSHEEEDGVAELMTSLAQSA